ncbi:hypothetical protein Slin15195_G016630 [Septoria linicola]|uniref:Uncharacterized protein n=1 Tax=Septoria linicola TaxID=215465 RepID=A0A9Q9EFX8_9PEZI|nr:hypothetical protein Slin14017_G016700 [Septoria linicola]USW48344.1 hypothetical protein Slin15195_G016630 [Septoria linicola]
MFAEGGGFAGSNSAGANLLPPGYTDSSLVNIPIKISDIRRKEPSDVASDPAIQLESKKPGKLSRIKGFVKHGSIKEDEEIVVVH